jgi:hypothetical protein
VQESPNGSGSLASNTSEKNAVSEKNEANEKNEAAPLSDFEKELHWCIEQLKLGLKRKGATPEQSMHTYFPPLLCLLCSTHLHTLIMLLTPLALA